MTRLPGEDLYSGMTPAQRAARKLMDEYNRLNDATTRREEWMCVQAIVTGQIPIVGPGVNEVIDFGFTNKIKLDGTKQWGKTAAKPIEDLEDWTEKVLTGGFTNVDRVIMGKWLCAPSSTTRRCRSSLTTAASTSAATTPATCLTA